MPELPEVETVARQLARLAQGRTLRDVMILDTKRLAAPPEGRFLRGRSLGRIERIGKQVVIELAPTSDDPRALWLAVHLRMTGRLIVEEHLPSPSEAHLRAVLRLDRGAISFRDPRRFGTFAWLDDRSAAEPIGLDPTTPGFTPAELRSLLRGSRQALKLWLLRQDKLVGLGNIYASEILHRARLSPQRHGGTLTHDEVVRLHESTASVLAAAIDNCGTTFSDFQDAHGVTGSYQSLLQVYGRAGEPCPRCGAAIRRISQGQRSTFYCTRCVRRGAA